MRAPLKHRKRLAAVAAATAATGLLTGAMLLGYEVGDHAERSTGHDGGAAVVTPAGARTGSIHFVGDEGGTVVGVPLDHGGAAGSAGASGFAGVPDVIAAS
ncbi:hypothetical protein [Streptomyces sp. NPDC057939]|uniref:hypothetical protein n=1 Tax=Streptomyces sp. NPDC057939 TaxID=3346284 RepID=UPI0036EA8395